MILSFFLERLQVFFNINGAFKIVEGASAEIPEPPKSIDNAMKLATIALPPFTFKPTDVIVRREKTQRFTMKDIGRLKNR